MDHPSLISDIRMALPDLPLRENEPLRQHCSFRIGGPAALFAMPRSVEELEKLCTLLAQKGVEPFLMGNGTNLLLPDQGLDRIVIQTCPDAGTVTVQGTQITAACGARLSSVAVAAQEHGLTGLEFAHGIPGSVGGGVIMDAGAYGGELKDVTVCVDILDEDRRPHTIQRMDLDFSYRHSALSDRDCVVLRAVFELAPGDPDAISGRMRELAEKRRSSQPLDMPSAGSVFKRPVGGFAAALIQEAGLMGTSVGGAQVSTKHAGFIVNTGDATCEDVLRLLDLIQATVLERSGISLEPEIRIIRP